MGVLLHCYDEIHPSEKRKFPLREKEPGWSSGDRYRLFGILSHFILVFGDSSFDATFVRVIPYEHRYLLRSVCAFIGFYHGAVRRFHRALVLPRTRLPGHPLLVRDHVDQCGFARLPFSYSAGRMACNELFNYGA